MGLINSTESFCLPICSSMFIFMWATKKYLFSAPILRKYVFNDAKVEEYLLIFGLEGKPASGLAQPFCD